MSYSGPCICGHSESMHRRAIGGCRGKNCTCPDYANESYYVWRQACLEAQRTSLLQLRARLDSANADRALSNSEDLKGYR